MELDVAVPVPLPQTFSYLGEGPIAAGTRVLVPFGGRKLVGVVLPKASEKKRARDYDLKPIHSIVDVSPVYSAVMLRLAQWLATYYLHPIGEVLRAMLPASATKLNKEQITLSAKGKALLGETQQASAHALLKYLFGKKDSLSSPSAKRKIEKFYAEQNKDDVLGLRLSLTDLKKMGFVKLSRSTLVTARKTVEMQADAPAAKPVTLDNISIKPGLSLTADQQRAFDEILRTWKDPDPANKKPTLLRGVTGSGKTEIYLQLIAAALHSQYENGLAQTLVLVPEISLTPQMTGVFSERFPGLVAVVHSAMTDTERWAEMERIRNQEALILIGPRSAVFGPFANLRLIIVDEEHDQSYKQATGLTYNGRDVAILRGKWENACVVLGSATPSLESFQNALTGKYHLLELHQRVNARPLPEVTLIKTKPPQALGVGLTAAAMAGEIPEAADDVPIADEILEAIENNLANGHQAMVIVNRRGFAYYLFSLKNRKAFTCPQCSISLTMHRRSRLLRCHYCDYSIATSEVMLKHPDDHFVAVGYGSEKVEIFLQKRFPQARLARLDSDMVVKRDLLPEILGQFKRGKLDILVGTQMLAKGHDFPNVTLMVLLDVDRTLDLPDFRAGERVFQLIVQSAGRAGRAELPGQVFIQLARPDHAVIQSAIKQDYLQFANSELQFRNDLRYPPFSRAVVFEFNDVDIRNLSQFCRRLEDWIERILVAKPELAQKLRILGPSTPAIETIRHRHRRTLLVLSKEFDALHAFSHALLTTFTQLPGDLRLKVDVDPQSLI